MAADQGAAGGKPVDFWLGAKFNDRRDEPRLTEMERSHPSFGGPDSGNERSE